MECSQQSTLPRPDLQVCASGVKLFYASQLLQQPRFRFQIKNHVQDLGRMISYTNQTTLGPLRDKIDNAIAPCNRLRRLNLSLDERAEKIQVAIWPATFYGTLVVAIGDKHFSALRRAATNVLVGDHKQASSHVALHYLSRRVQDPLLYIVSDDCSHTIQPSLHYIRAFNGTVKGPASAIAHYLHKIGWEITANATLLGPGGLRVSLRHASGKQIKSQARLAWDWYCP